MSAVCVALSRNALAVRNSGMMVVSTKHLLQCKNRRVSWAATFRQCPVHSSVFVMIYGKIHRPKV